MNYFVILLLLLFGGIYGVLHRIPLDDIGPSFYRLINLLFLVGMTLVLLTFTPTESSQWFQFALLLIVLCTGFIHRYSLHYDKQFLQKSSYWLTTTVLLFLIGSLTFQNPLPSLMEPVTSPLVNYLHLLTSAAILGSIVDAMICGHWYLVNTDLSLRPIRSISRTLTIAILLKIVLVGWSLLQTHSYDTYLFERIVFLMPILFWVRILVGLSGGLFFNWMSWKALEHGNTQAATGILYACITWIILGEFSAFYLTIQFGVPL